MKKFTLTLSAVLLLASGTFLTATAALAPAAKSVQVAYPDNASFYVGQNDADAYLQSEASLYGKGSAQYNSDVDAEIASAQQNVLSAAYESSDYYYWWGYRTQLQHHR